MQRVDVDLPSDQHFILAANTTDFNRDFIKKWLHILARVDFRFSSKSDIQFAAVITTLITNKIMSSKIDKITASIFFDCVCIGRHLVNLTIQLLLHAMSPSCIADIFLSRKLQWNQNLMVPQRTYRKHNVPYGFSHILALLMANNRFCDITIKDIIGHSFVLFLSTISNPSKMLTLPEFQGVFREYKFEMLLKNDYFDENKFIDMKSNELIEYVANIDFPAFSLLHAPIRYIMRECFNKMPPSPINIPDFCQRVHEMLEDDPTFAIDTLSSLLPLVHVKPAEAPVHLLCVGALSFIFLLYEALLDLYSEVDMSVVNEMINQKASPYPTIALSLASNLKIPSLRVLSERSEFDSLGSEWQTALVPIKKYLGFKTETLNLIGMLDSPNRNWAIASLLQDVASLPYLDKDTETIKLIRQFLSESTDLPRNRVDSITAMSLVNMSLHPAWENAPALLDHAIVLCDMVNKFTIKFPPPVAAAVKIGAKLKKLEHFVMAMPRRTVMSLFDGPMTQIECIKTHVVHLTWALKNMSPLVVGGDALAALVGLSLSGILCVDISDDLEECIGQRFVSARTSIALSLVSTALRSEFVTEVIDAAMPFLKMEEGFEVSLTALTRLVEIKSPSSIRIINEIENLGTQYLKGCGLTRIIALTECLLSFGYFDLMDAIINRIYLYGTPSEFLEVISKFILKNPSELLSVSDKLLDIPQSRPYLLHLIATCESSSKELIDLGLRIVRRCGEFNYDYKIEKTPKQSPAFPEDIHAEEEEQKTEEINLCGKCNGLTELQSFFYCQTCKMNGICVHCAIRCHSGHTLIPQPAILGVCQCQLQPYCKFISPSILSRNDLVLFALKVIRTNYTEESIEIVQKPTHEREGAFVLSKGQKQIIDMKTYWERIQKSTSHEAIAIRTRCAPTSLCVSFNQFTVYTNGFQVIFEDGIASHRKSIRLNNGILSLVPLSNCIVAIHGSSIILFDYERTIAEIRPSVVGTVLSVSEVITGHGQPNMIGLVSTRSIDIFSPKNNYKMPITATRNMNITSAVFIGSPLKGESFCIVCSHPDSSLSILRSTPRGLAKFEGLPVGVLQEPIVSRWNDRVFISGSCGRLVCTTVKSIIQKDLQIVSIDLPKASSPAVCVGEVTISEINAMVFQSPTGVLTFVTPNDRELSVTSLGKTSTIVSFRPFILDSDGFVRCLELGRAHRRAPPPEWLTFKPFFMNCDMKLDGITLSCNGQCFKPGTSFIDSTKCIDVTSTAGDIVAIAIDIDAVSAGDTGIDIDINGWPCPGDSSPYIGVIKPTKSAFIEITTEGEVEIKWIKVFIGKNKAIHPGCERDGSILCSIARSMSDESPPIAAETISQLAAISYTKGGRWVREMIRRSGALLNPRMLLPLRDIGGNVIASSAEEVEEDIRRMEPGLSKDIREIQKIVFAHGSASESKIRISFL